MIEKSSERSSKSQSSKVLEEEEATEIPNLRLFCRKEPDPEEDKSSGVSSDEETTSSSLVPIPDTLKQLRNKTKWTLTDNGDLSDNAYFRGGLLKSTGNTVNSFEELRRKYTLKNEASVALKMNSASLMLDDILNGTNVNNPLTDNSQSTLLKKEEFREKTDFESESTSVTETRSTPHPPCPHIIDYPHHPVAFDMYSSCPRHYNVDQPICSPKEKDVVIPKLNLDSNQRKKSLVEKLQDLHIKYKIQSMYKNLQKTRNPFKRTRKDFDNNVHQGIPRTDCQEDKMNKNEPMYKCNCPLNRCPKKMVLDLTECSETSPSETNTERGHVCTCVHQRKCECLELQKCFCVQHVQMNSKDRKNGSLNSDLKEDLERKEIINAIRAVSLESTRNENESSSGMDRENPRQNLKPNPQPKDYKGEWRHCTKEKKLIERTDIYYFDHGNSAYYKTTDNHPLRYTECLVERTDEYATKFWAEFFGTIEIGIAFLISFILQLYRFLFTSIIRSLTVGLLQIFSDYFFKPLLTILFNGIIQPCLILAYNIATSVRDLCLPISEIFGFYAKEIATILRSCRLIDMNYDRQSSYCCGNKV